MVSQVNIRMTTVEVWGPAVAIAAVPRQGGQHSESGLEGTRQSGGLKRRANRHMECIQNFTQHRQDAIQRRRFMMNALSPREIEVSLKGEFRQAF